MIPLLLRSSRLATSHRLPLSTPTLLRRAHITPLSPTHNHPLSRTYANPTRSPIDHKIDEITELYATAKDEFEIASEETDKKTVYAADDRAAAAEELAKVKAAFEKAVGEEGGAEIMARIGTRIRELERAVEAMEERAMED